MIAYVPVIVLIVGLLLYMMPLKDAYTKVNEAGRIAYFVGLFWIVAQFAGKTFKLFAFIALVSVACMGCASGTDGLRQTIANTAVTTAEGYRLLGSVDKARQHIIQVQAKAGDPVAASKALKAHLERYGIAEKTLDVAVETLKTANATIPALEKGLHKDKDISDWVSKLIKLASDITESLHNLEVL